MGGSGWTAVKEIAYHFSCYPVNHDIREKKKKETKKTTSALRHARTDFRSMMSEERLNLFIMDVHIRKKPVH